MPIEIRELVIKASISEVSGEADGSAAEDSSAIDKEEIIADCVEQVMEILRLQAER
jgi:hypothetical protein